MEGGIDRKVKLDNDDKFVLESLSAVIGAEKDEGVNVLNYQICRQRWKKGERDPILRVCVVTDSHVYMLNERFWGSNGNGDELSLDGDALADGIPTLSIVDKGALKFISEIRPADEDPKAVTLKIGTGSKLMRSHRWRLILRNRVQAEKFVQDVRKAIAALG